MEILIVSVLIGFVGLSFAAIYATAHRYMVQDSTSVLSQGEASFAADHIKRQVMVANRIVRFSDTEIAFRFDPNPDGTNADQIDFSDDQWAGYRLEQKVLPDDRIVHFINFYPNLKKGQDPPVDKFSGTSEVIARNVLTPGGAIPALFQLPGPTLLLVDLTVEKKIGADIRQLRLKTHVSPRGVSS